ncbi:MAG TPA: hypothetical protein VF509_05455 [Sphingobium sp.]
MWIRAAYWIGTISSENVDALTQAINEDVVPALRRLPGVKDALALWPRRYEHEAPAIACQLLIYFDSKADLDTMLESPERQAFRLGAREAIALFNGSISHVDFEVAA